MKWRYFSNLRPKISSLCVFQTKDPMGVIQYQTRTYSHATEISFNLWGEEIIKWIEIPKPQEKKNDRKSI